MLSPSFGISEYNFTRLSTVEFKIVVFRQGLYIVEFSGSRCLIAGSYYVSSANLHRKLPGVVALRSPAFSQHMQRVNS